MKKIYIISIIIALAGGVFVAFTSDSKNRKEAEPQEMLNAILDESRFISTDELAHIIISENPAYFIIDVRSEEEYKKFSLPGAYNIPLDSILNKEVQYILNQKQKKNIFISNGTIKANQAWLLTRRLNYKNNYVLRGGINKWFQTIIFPKAPKYHAEEEEQEKYRFRLAAKQHFTGAKVKAVDVKSDAPVVPVKKKEVKKGGC